MLPCMCPKKFKETQKVVGSPPTPSKYVGGPSGSSRSGLRAPYMHTTSTMGVKSRPDGTTGGGKTHFLVPSSLGGDFEGGLIARDFLGSAVDQLI